MNLFTEKNNIAGVVIVYNPDKSVISNIISYLNQISSLFIIDNSFLPNEEMFSGLIDTPGVYYLPQKKNIGISAALNLAAQLAIRKGFKYLLTMDQDSIVSQDMIRKMLTLNCEYNKIGIIAPFFINRYRTRIPGKEPFKKILFEKTSGNLLNLDTYSKIGPFDENLFIDYVDIEYCFRLNSAGFEVIQVNGAELIHNEAFLSSNKFLFKIVYPWNHNPIRWLYKIRNLFYLRDKYYKEYPSFFKNEYKNYLKQFIKIFLFEDKKFSKLKFAIKGYSFYKKRKMGSYNGR